MFLRLILCPSLLAFSAATALAGSDAPPSWLQQAAAANPPTYDKDVPAVVLVNDQKVTLTLAIGQMVRMYRDLRFEGRYLEGLLRAVFLAYFLLGPLAIYRLFMR